MKPSDTSQCSQGSGDLILESNKPLAINNAPRSSKTRKGGTGLLVKQDQMFALQTSPHYVLASAKSTSTPINYLQATSQLSKIMETQQILTPVIYPTLICSVEAFLANHSALLESGEGFKTLEAPCFSTLQEYLKLKNLVLYSSKTSRAYSITTKGKLSKSLFKRWGNWGITFSGWYLTASFSEFPRTENGCSLSEVLEEHPDSKYYLSEKTIFRLTQRAGNRPKFVTQLPHATISKETQLPMSSIISMGGSAKELDCKKISCPPSELRKEEDTYP